MAVSERRHWLIAYDVRAPRRLARLHRVVVKSALRVHYSVYLFEGTVTGLRRLLAEIDAEIEPAEDDVRAYQVPSRPDLTLLGRKTGVSGLTISGSAGSFLARLQGCAGACEGP